MTAYQELGELEKRAYGQQPMPAAGTPQYWSSTSPPAPPNQPGMLARTGTALNRNKFAMLGGFAGTGMGLGIASVPIGIAGSWLGSKLDNHFNKERDAAEWRVGAQQRIDARQQNPFSSLGNLGATMIGKGMPPAPAAT